MCGRYSWAQKKVSTQLEKLEVPPPPTSVSYNRAPGQEHPVVIKTTKKTDWSMAKWGIIPSQKLASSRLNPINARIETVREKSIFQDSLLHRRCLVPADGYFEWQKIDSQKYPYFHYLTNQHMFAMAGIWNETKKEEGCVRSFSVLTQPASLKFTPYPSSHASYNKSARLVGLVGQRFPTRPTTLVLFTTKANP